jgi:multidrug efflux pump subunit AcrA (membrane-fusion protein)
MKATSSMLLPLVAAIGLTLSACGGSSYRSPTPQQPAPTPPAQTSFTTFTQAQFTAAATSETALPVEVESTDFAFPDDDNPAAFDGVINAAM